MSVNLGLGKKRSLKTMLILICALTVGCQNQTSIHSTMSTTPLYPQTSYKAPPSAQKWTFDKCQRSVEFDGTPFVDDYTLANAQKNFDNAEYEGFKTGNSIEETICTCRNGADFSQMTDFQISELMKQAAFTTNGKLENYSKFLINNKPVFDFIINTKSSIGDLIYRNRIFTNGECIFTVSHGSKVSDHVQEAAYRFLNSALDGPLLQPPAIPTTPVAPQKSAESRIIELNKLFQNKLITKEEYELKRTEIMSGL